MKKYILKQITLVGILSAGLMMASCEDFLDRAPLDQITPEVYLNSEDHLAAYSINRYSFPSHGGWSASTLRGDVGTDNAAQSLASYNLWVPGNYKVPNKDGDYSFSAIRQCNYFFDVVLPRYEAGTISGSPANIKHYIGEMYFLRAWSYFNMLKRYGDFPIVTTVPLDDIDELIGLSERAPRNMVARFIIEDIEMAISYMHPEFKAKNRLSSNVAQLFKSRVALYEASWLKYHKGTPFVPGGAGWPGADADYNADFSIDIDNEINFFLDKAIESSKVVADGYVLTENNGVTNPISPSALTEWNPYAELFSAFDMAPFDEVLMWKKYDNDLGITHGVGVYIRAGSNYGVTRGQVEAFTMKNGLPWYAPGSGWKGDETLEDVKMDKDERLQLFLTTPSDVEFLTDTIDPFRMPYLLAFEETRDVTGYYLRKGYNLEDQTGTGLMNQAGCIIFRRVEANLNYIEASYMKTGAIDGTAAAYWTAIRTRAGVAGYQITIDATDMSKEAIGDWGTHSTGTMVDATLYNIRRERRNEFMGESMRWDDLKRWRALDHVKNYQIEGFNLWDKNFDHKDYKEGGKADGKSLLISSDGDGTPNISPKSKSKYVRPYQINPLNNEVYDGYNWSKAMYLSPLPAYQILLTSTGAGTSPLYQNPYWPATAGGQAEQ